MNITQSNSVSNESGTFLQKLNSAAEKRITKITLAATLAFGATTLAACSSPETNASDPSIVQVEVEQTLSPSVENEQASGNQTVEHKAAVTQENLEEVISENRIDSSLSPAEKAEKVSSIMTDLFTAGATIDTVAENRKNISEGAQPQNEALADQIANSNLSAYGPALFGENWQSQPLLTEFKTINANNITRFDTTFNSDEFPAYGTASKEAYTEDWSTNVILEGYATATEATLPILEGGKYEAQDVLGEQPFTIIRYTAQRTNNAEKTTYKSDSSYSENNGSTIYVDALLVSEDGYDVVKALKMSSSPIVDVDYRSIPQ